MVQDMQNDVLAGRWYTVVPGSGGNNGALELFGTLPENDVESLCLVRCHVDWEARHIEVETHISTPGQWDEVLEHVLEFCEEKLGTVDEMTLIIPHTVALLLFQADWLRYEDFLTAKEVVDETDNSFWISLEKTWPSQDELAEEDTSTLTLMIIDGNYSQETDGGIALFDATGEHVATFHASKQKQTTMSYDSPTAE